MALKSINDLKTAASEELGLDYDNIPEERGSLVPPPYPGDYVYQLPKDLTGNWDEFEDRDKKKWQSLVFDDDNPLTVSSSLSEANAGEVGKTVRTRINNKPRGRGKEKILVSDMTYLQRVLEPTAKPRTLAELNAIVSRQGGKVFIAALEWTGSCNPKRPIYVATQDPETGRVTYEEGKNHDTGVAIMGCDARYYMSDWPKGEDGRYLDAFECQGKDGQGCGAVIRPFAQLNRFRQA